jgi:hypothetical protein
VEVEAPCPYTYGVCQSRGTLDSSRLVERLCIPSTIIRATRYGNGRIRVKPSISGSTAGSPSMLRVKCGCRGCVPASLLPSNHEACQQRVSLRSQFVSARNPLSRGRKGGNLACTIACPLAPKAPPNKLKLDASHRTEPQRHYVSGSSGRTCGTATTVTVLGSFP